MKFIHLADLHIGKRLNEYSLIDDQKYILDEILKITREENADAVIIAGDIYDRAAPSAEAVSTVDGFLTSLAKMRVRVFAVSGNHDCAERVAYGEKLFDNMEVYVSPVFAGEMGKIALRDEFGAVNVYMLPFIKPAYVRRFFPEKEIESMNDAVRCVLESAAVDESERNILIAHQFAAGSRAGGSEDASLGTLEAVDPSLFSAFDYTALGHIHSPQSVGTENIRYSGSPLKYSAQEVKTQKSVTVAELCEKGKIKISAHPLAPIRDFHEIKGKMADVERGGNERDYVKITLTDEGAVPDAYGRLKAKYPFLTEIVFERETRLYAAEREAAADKSEIEQFADFFEAVNGVKLTREQEDFVKKLFDEIKEGEL